METEKLEEIMAMKKKDDMGKYEAKYKDLKESFRLYRKKAKEIFETQQRGDVAVSFKFQKLSHLLFYFNNFPFWYFALDTWY